MLYHRNRKVIWLALCFAGLLIVSAIILLFAGTEYQIVDTDYSGPKEQSVASPSFSVKSGFFDEPFFLEIIIPEGTTVYYTLDCSDPTIESTVYNGPIYLENASMHENVFSMRTDLSTGFYEKLIDEYAGEKIPGYSAPDYYIEKCCVVRAVSVDKDGNNSEIVSESYFIGMGELCPDNCRVISIVTDPANLFDYNTGIYVTGKHFENYQLTGNYNALWHWWDANYRQKGKAWERKVYFTLFDENGTIITEKSVGIRIQGNATRGFLPRNLQLFSRVEYDGQAFFEGTIFAEGYCPKKILLFCGEAYSQFNDYCINARSKDLNYATMSFQPCVLFLDGEYWGFYWLAEKFDEYYIQYHYGVRYDNIVMIKEDEVVAGKAEDYQLYINASRFITDNDMSKESNYLAACQLYDMDSYIDYYATRIYIGSRDDWPSSNYALWRSLQKGDGEYEDNRWRWMMFDCNAGNIISSAYVEENTLKYVLEVDRVFASLWKNDGFRNKFCSRILDIADSYFSGDDMRVFIQDYKQNFLPLLSQSWDRYYGKNNSILEKFNSRMSSAEQFFLLRSGVIRSWFE